MLLVKNLLPPLLLCVEVLKVYVLINYLLQHRLFQNEKEHPIVKVGIDRGRKFDDANVVVRLKNHVLHSRSKHVDIKHHFIQDLIEDKVVSLELFPIEGQIVNNVTKPLDTSRFESLRSPIGFGNSRQNS